MSHDQATSLSRLFNMLSALTFSSFLSSLPSPAFPWGVGPKIILTQIKACPCERSSGIANASCPLYFLQHILWALLFLISLTFQLPTKRYQVPPTPAEKTACSPKQASREEPILSGTKQRDLPEPPTSSTRQTTQGWALEWVRTLGRCNCCDSPPCCRGVWVAQRLGRGPVYSGETEA